MSLLLICMFSNLMLEKLSPYDLFGNYECKENNNTVSHV